MVGLPHARALQSDRDRGRGGAGWLVAALSLSLIILQRLRITTITSATNERINPDLIIGLILLTLSHFFLQRLRINTITSTTNERTNRDLIIGVTLLIALVTGMLIAPATGRFPSRALYKPITWTARDTSLGSVFSSALSSSLVVLCFLYSCATFCFPGSPWF
jgi:nitrate reductase gamma subunit